MFSKSSKSPSNASPTSTTGGSGSGGKSIPFSLIGGDVTIVGTVTASVDLHIDGRIEGDIVCAALVQGTESRIIGHVRATSARIAGTVEGSITTDELVIVRTGKVTGDVTYERITIEAGGQVEGRFAHKDGGIQPPELKLIANDSAA